MQKQRDRLAKLEECHQPDIEMPTAIRFVEAVRNDKAEVVASDRGNPVMYLGKAPPDDAGH